MARVVAPPRNLIDVNDGLEDDDDDDWGQLGGRNLCSMPIASRLLVGLS